MGLGTSQGGNPKAFVRDTVVVAQTSYITLFVFNVRDASLTTGQTVTAEIYRSTDGGATNFGTGITATVTGPNPPNFCAHTTVPAPGYQVNQCDLLSVKITTSTGTGALADGAAATISLSF